MNVAKVGVANTIIGVAIMIVVNVGMANTIM